MPLEGLDEEGLPKNPDLSLTELKFLLNVDEETLVNKEEVWTKLLASVKENGTLTSHGVLALSTSLTPSESCPLTVHLTTHTHTHPENSNGPFLPDPLCGCGETSRLCPPC